MRVAIVGGGPIGVEAALYGACAGFEVHLFERHSLAANVRRWGHVRVFTDWKRNRSPLACRMLRDANWPLAADDSTSTGDELADYVERLAQFPQLQGRLFPGTEVVQLTRERCLKSDFVGQPQRAEHPFRLQLKSGGVERTEFADTVIDATGVYATPNWMGNGGAPCKGEYECGPWIDYSLPDVVGRDLRRFAGKHTLIVGSGHSAASTLRSVAELFGLHPTTRITWVVRRDVPEHGAPYTLIEDDPSPHRNALHARANELASHPQVEFMPRSSIDGIAIRGGAFEVVVTPADRPASTINCDNVVVHTGFRPDDSLWRELQVLVHPATGGPFHLSEVLLENNRRAGVGLSTGYAEKRPPQQKSDDQTDRWKVQLSDPELHRHPEPNFFVIGIKSYGRDAGFLMQNGFRQVRDVYKLISGDQELDLYEGALS